MSFHATRLLARYILSQQLSRGDKISLTPAASLIDALPYNSDLQPLPHRAKLLLTLFRFAAVAVSVYVGAALDGAVAPENGSFAATEATAVATKSTEALIENTGLHIPAMAKLSCLRIVDNNHVTLYRGYVASQTILCEDGVMTYTKKALVSARIRDEDETKDQGEDISSLNIADQEPQSGRLVKNDKSIVYYRRVGTDSDSPEETLRIVLMQRRGDACSFGVRRSSGSGFPEKVDVKLTTTCNVRILDFSRMLAPKPSFLPPRMTFLHQTLDAIVVSERVDGGPTPKGDVIQATITLPGLVTVVVTAVVITVSSIVFWFALRSTSVKKDVTCVKGLAEIWGEEKFGTTSQDGVFVALAAEGGSPYLGSVDGQKSLGKKGMDLSDLEDGKRVSHTDTSSSGFDDSVETDESVTSGEA